MKPPRKPAQSTEMVGFRVPVELRDTIAVWLAQHREESLQSLGIRGFTLAMDEKQTKRAKNAPEIAGTIAVNTDYNLENPVYRDWVRFVIDIFNSGKQDDIDGLIWNILAFKRGHHFDELYALLADHFRTLKRQGVSPDATFTTALSEASDFSRTLARARDALKHLHTSEEGSGKTSPKRAG